MLIVDVQDLLGEVTLKQHLLSNQKIRNAFSSFWSHNYKSTNIFHSLLFKYSDTWI